MAKQKGIITLQGTLGGINFYYLNGQPVARQAGGGFNSTAIKTKPSMARVRENSREFGACSVVNKSFRHALMPFYEGVRFCDFHSRLLGLFTRIKNLDGIHPRGARTVEAGLQTADGQGMMVDFVYTPHCDVLQVLPFRHLVSEDLQQLDMLDFNIRQVSFLSGATHVGLTYGVLDMLANPLSLNLYLSEPVLLDRDYVGSSLSLTVADLPEHTERRFCILGVRFYQMVDGKAYPMMDLSGVGFTVLKCL